MSLRDELEAIRERYGKLDPPTVVEAARSKSHPLHGRFEWNNTVAGEAWRREQAHRLIQAVRIIDLRSADGPRHLRAYVAIPQSDSDQPDYRPLEEVALDPFASKLLLAEAEREWRTMRQRYGHLEEFIALVREDVGAA